MSELLTAAQAADLAANGMFIAGTYKPNDGEIQARRPWTALAGPCERCGGNDSTHSEFDGWLGDCPWFLGLKHDDGSRQTCAYGCREEPECETCCPDIEPGGWGPEPSPRGSPCWDCEGTGKQAVELVAECENCMGVGWWIRGRNEMDIVGEQTQCRDCNGEGKRSLSWFTFEVLPVIDMDMDPWPEQAFFGISKGEQMGLLDETDALIQRTHFPPPSTKPGDYVVIGTRCE